MCDRVHDVREGILATDEAAMETWLGQPPHDGCTTECLFASCRSFFPCLPITARLRR